MWLGHNSASIISIPFCFLFAVGEPQLLYQKGGIFLLIARSF